MNGGRRRRAGRARGGMGRGGRGRRKGGRKGGKEGRGVDRSNVYEKRTRIRRDGREGRRRRIPTCDVVYNERDDFIEGNDAPRIIKINSEARIG